MRSVHGLDPVLPDILSVRLASDLDGDTLWMVAMDKIHPFLGAVLRETDPRSPPSVSFVKCWWWTCTHSAVGILNYAEAVSVAGSEIHSCSSLTFLAKRR